MRKSLALLVSATTLFSGCATVPAECPKLPPPPAKGPPAPNFQALMRDFLSGSLPKPLESPPSSPSVGPGSTK